MPHLQVSRLSSLVTLAVTALNLITWPLGQGVSFPVESANLVTILKVNSLENLQPTDQLTLWLS